MQRQGERRRSLAGQRVQRAALARGQRRAADIVPRSRRHPALGVLYLLGRLPVRRILEVQVCAAYVRLPPVRERHVRIVRGYLLRPLGVEALLQRARHQVHPVRIHQRHEVEPRGSENLHGRRPPRGVVRAQPGHVPQQRRRRYPLVCVVCRREHAGALPFPEHQIAQRPAHGAAPEGGVFQKRIARGQGAHALRVGVGAPAYGRHRLERERHHDFSPRLERQQIQAGIRRGYLLRRRAVHLRHVRERLPLSESVHGLRAGVRLQRAPHGATRLAGGSDARGALKREHGLPGLCTVAPVHIQSPVSGAAERRLQQLHQGAAAAVFQNFHVNNFLSPG